MLECTCEICGSTYISLRKGINKYCPDCRVIGQNAKKRKWDRENRDRERYELHIQWRSEKLDAIAEVVRDADKAGMSYGAYVAAYGV